MFPISQNNQALCLPTIKCHWRKLTLGAIIPMFSICCAWAKLSDNGIVAKVCLTVYLKYRAGMGHGKCPLLLLVNSSQISTNELVFVLPSMVSSCQITRKTAGCSGGRSRREEFWQRDAVWRRAGSGSLRRVCKAGFWRSEQVTGCLTHLNVLRPGSYGHPPPPPPSTELPIFILPLSFGQNMEIRK